MIVVRVTYTLFGKSGEPIARQDWQDEMEVGKAIDLRMVVDSFFKQEE